MYWLKEQMGSVGITCEAVATGMQEMLNGERIDLPPVILAQLGTSPNKKTLLVYGYVDVEPADKKDGWKTEPFKLAEKDGQLYGRGVADNKAAVILWISAIEMLQKHNIDIPLNIKFCFEGMAHCGSLGVEWVLRKRSEIWLQDVDFVCITDGQWLGNRKPCLSYGARGVCQFRIEVSTEGRDLHSGVHGGAVYEPMADLCWILDHLTDVTGKITIPGFDKLIAPPNEKEQELFESLDFDIEEYRKSIGASELTGTSKVQLLTRIWRCPSLSIHGLEGGYNGGSCKGVIPSKAFANLSVHIVPNMIPDRVNNLVVNYVNMFWPKRCSPNSIKIYPQHCIYPWITTYSLPHFEAANRAIRHVYGVDADLTRQSRPIPAALILQHFTGGSVIVMPLNSRDDAREVVNEKLQLRTYIAGVKTIIAYLFELSSI
uniref:Cytosolic non-specific dipeptidase n=1 Tax=Ascaris suum TaxID=6253 RepID=F1L3A8_ASCSU